LPIPAAIPRELKGTLHKATANGEASAQRASGVAFHSCSCAVWQNETEKTNGASDDPQGTLLRILESSASRRWL
jgi:hypothetical protein